MKPILFTLFLLCGLFVQAQDYIEMDTIIYSDHYYDDLDEALKNKENVWYLDLGMQSPKLTEMPGEVTEFPNLKQLILTFNRVGNIGDQIGELTQLEKLDLEGNHYLADISDEIANCKALKELNIRDSRLDEDEVEKLKEQLPDTKIIY